MEIRAAGPKWKYGHERQTLKSVSLEKPSRKVADPFGVIFDIIMS